LATVGKTLEVTAGRLLILDLYEDQYDRLEAATSKTYYFHAAIEDAAVTVDLDPLSVPAGWNAELLDSAETSPLNGTLGVVEPDQPKAFALRVQTPPADLSGSIDTMATRTFVIRGFVREDPAVSDSVTLTLNLVPPFSIHNYPNPLKDRTRFILGLPRDGRLTLTIYNRAGERIKRLLENVEVLAGVMFHDWDAKNDAGSLVAPGTFRYVLDYAHDGVNTRVTKKLVVVRK
jgi:hypothetical protein